MSSNINAPLFVSASQAIQIAQFTLYSLHCGWQGCTVIANSWMSLNNHVHVRHCQATHSRPPYSAQDGPGNHQCHWQHCQNTYAAYSELYRHIMKDHIATIELPCVVIGCTSVVQSSMMHRHLWFDHKYPDAPEQDVVPVQRRLDRERSTPRPDSVWHQTLDTPDTPLDNIPNRLMPSHEVTALTVRPGPRSLFNATRIADRSADPVHYPRWVREASPETDLTFGALPATANTAYGVLAPTAPLPAFLSNIRRLPQPDDPQAAAQLAAAVQQDVVMVPRLLAPNAGDIGSHLARIPNVTREPRAAPPPPRRLAGFDAFQVQFNTAKMKNQIDGRGQFFDPTDG